MADIDEKGDAIPTHFKGEFGFPDDHIFVLGGTLSSGTHGNCSVIPSEGLSDHNILMTVVQKEKAKDIFP